MRKSVMTRKGAPSLAIVIGRGAPRSDPAVGGGEDDDEGPAGEEPGETAGDEAAEDVGACPECGCTFNYDSGKVLEHGLLQGGPGPEGGGENAGGAHMPLQPEGANPGDAK